MEIYFKAKYTAIQICILELKKKNSLVYGIHFYISFKKL